MSTSARGFTLIELLVTISIIAVLSAIGFVVFSNVQKTARDSKRMGDINAIFQAMEMRYGQCSPGTYCDLNNTSFIGGDVPRDPLTGQSKCSSNGADYCGYCFSSFDPQPGGDPNWANHGCPDNLPPEPDNWWVLAKIGSPRVSSGSYYTEFILCANLENQVNGKWYYCKSSK